MYHIYRFRVNTNNEIIGCSCSRKFKTLEDSLKYLARCENADFIDYSAEKEYVKRNGEVIVKDFY